MRRLVRSAVVRRLVPSRVARLAVDAVMRLAPPRGAGPAVDAAMRLAPPRGARPAVDAVVRRLGRSRVARLVAAAVAVVVTVGMVRDRLPAPVDVVAVLREANPWWFAAALAAATLSQLTFGLVQRRLLAAFGVRLGLSRTMLLALVRSALASILPAGGAVSAAYAYRTYRSHGARTAAAVATAALSNLASIAAFVLIYACGLAVATAHTHHWPLPAILAVLLLAALAVESLRPHRTEGRPTIPALAALTSMQPGGLFPVPRATFANPAAPAGSLCVAIAPARVPAPAAPALPSPTAPPSGRSAGRLRGWWGKAKDVLRQVRSIRGRDRAITSAYAVANWLLDLACLAAVARACGLPLPIATLAAAYLAVQVVRQIPITPGGVGLIETSLLTALTAGGATVPAAAAVVLGYRLLSFWLILPAGLVAHTVLRRPPLDAA